MLSWKNMCWRDGAPGLKPSLFQIRYEDISLRYYDNPERSCAGVYKIETHAWAPRIPWHLTSGEKQMNLKYKELRREAPTRHIMESKHTEAAPPSGRGLTKTPHPRFSGIFCNWVTPKITHFGSKSKPSPNFSGNLINYTAFSQRILKILDNLYSVSPMFLDDIP